MSVPPIRLDGAKGIKDAIENVRRGMDMVERFHGHREDCSIFMCLAVFNHDGTLATLVSAPVSMEGDVDTQISIAMHTIRVNANA